MASVLKRSILWDHITPERSSDARVSDWNSDLKKATEAFRRETIVSLGIVSADNRALTYKYEHLRPFILKTLIFVNFSDDCRTVGLMARIIEILASHTELELNYVIEHIASTACVGYDSVSKLIDRYFNVYDNKIYERISFLTCTSPFTAKDAICDLALYVRTKFF